MCSHTQAASTTGRRNPYIRYLKPSHDNADELTRCCASTLTSGAPRTTMCAPGRPGPVDPTHAEPHFRAAVPSH